MSAFHENLALFRHAQHWMLDLICAICIFTQHQPVDVIISAQQGTTMGELM
jgi:hypothetical protein